MDKTRLLRDKKSNGIAICRINFINKRGKTTESTKGNRKEQKKSQAKTISQEIKWSEWCTGNRENMWRILHGGTESYEDSIDNGF